MPKEQNPAAAQRKADKQKAIAKNKKQVQQQRNEKLAHKNPERVQREIDELKDSTRPKDQERLKQLERDVKGIKRARDALGDAAPKFAERRNPREQQLQRRQNQHLGKRRRDEQDAQSSDSDPEVRDIPMPRDTPPPIPRAPRNEYNGPQTGPNSIRIPHQLPAKPAAPAQTVYSSAPQIKDLKKEAVRFMPSAVAAQKKRVKGEGRLLEPEEADKLEQSGYIAAQKAANEAEKEAKLNARSEVPGPDLDVEMRKFEAELQDAFPAEEEKAPRPVMAVRMEEVEDEGD